MSPLFLDGLLILDLLLLAATLWLAGRLLAKARIKNPQEASDSPEEKVGFQRAQFWQPHDAEPVVLGPQQPFFSDQSTLAELRPQAPSEATAAIHFDPPLPSPPALDSLKSEPLQFRQMGSGADLFADPIDGTLFLDGEEILICKCGVGYHAETWEWIRTQHSEKCVHCGARNSVEKRVVPPRGIGI